MIAGTGTGYALFKISTVNSKEMKEKFPEANIVHYNSTQSRSKDFMRVLKKAAESDKPLYRENDLKKFMSEIQKEK